MKIYTIAYASFSEEIYAETLGVFTDFEEVKDFIVEQVKTIIKENFEGCPMKDINIRKTTSSFAIDNGNLFVEVRIETHEV